MPLSQLNRMYIARTLGRHGLTVDPEEVTNNDPFWGQLIAHAITGADMISDRGADLSEDHQRLLATYLTIRSVEVLYFGECLTELPEFLAMRVHA